MRASAIVEISIEVGFRSGFCAIISRCILCAFYGGDESGASFQSLLRSCRLFVTDNYCHPTIPHRYVAICFVIDQKKTINIQCRTFHSLSSSTPTALWLLVAEEIVFINCYKGLHFTANSIQFLLITITWCGSGNNSPGTHKRTVRKQAESRKRRLDHRWSWSGQCDP